MTPVKCRLRKYQPDFLWNKAYDVESAGDVWWATDENGKRICGANECWEKIPCLTREQAKTIALSSINEFISKNGENAVFVASPKIGKNVWTGAEVKNAIINVKPLEEMDYNMIDSMLELDKFLIENRGYGLSEEEDAIKILNNIEVDPK